MSKISDSKDGTAIERMKQVQRDIKKQGLKTKKIALSNCENLSKVYCSKPDKKGLEHCKCDPNKQYKENNFMKDCRITLQAENTSYLDVMEEYGITDKDTLSEEDLKKYNVCGETKEEEAARKPKKKKGLLRRMISRGGRRRRKRSRRKRRRRRSTKKRRRRRSTKKRRRRR